MSTMRQQILERAIKGAKAATIAAEVSRTRGYVDTTISALRKSGKLPPADPGTPAPTAAPATPAAFVLPPQLNITPSRAASAVNQTQALEIRVSARGMARLAEAASAAGLRTHQYAQLLFDAAYAAKVGGGSLDRDIDRTVALAALTIELDAGDVAAALGCELALVERIRGAWRAAIDAREAA